MQEHILIRPAEPVKRKSPIRLLRALSAAFYYGTLWACASRMCGLSTLGILPLSAGLAAAVLLSVLPERKRLTRLMPILILALSAVLTLARLPETMDGCGLMLNRLFQASAARHSYLYETFSVSEGTQSIAWALLCLGLTTGLWIGVTAGPGRKAFFVLPAVLLLAAIAWLGISPEPVWLILLTVSLVLHLILDGLRISKTALVPIGAACLAAFLIAVLQPGRNASLTAWGEAARDRLAFRTVYYGELAGENNDSGSGKDSPGSGNSGKKPFYQKDEKNADDGGEIDLLRPIQIGLLILLILLLLFGPALWSDRLKRLRAANRAGLDSEDARTCICANFLYGLRFLREAGLIPDNLPFSSYAGTIRALQTELGEAFDQALPVWHRAAYSAHRIEEPQRETALRFSEGAKRLAEANMTWKKKLKVRYWTAL